MSYVDDLKARIQDTLESALTALDKAERYGPRAIRRAVEDSFPHIPRPQSVDDIAAEALIEQLDEAVRLARRGVQMLEGASDYLGSPDALRAAAGRLSSDVAAVCEDLGSDVRLDNLRAVLPSAWDDGDASVRYVMSFDGQSRAVDKIREYALLFLESLQSMADGIEEYYLEVLWATASFALAIGSAVITVLTAPTGVGAIVGGIGVILGALSAFVALGQLVEALFKDRGETFRDKISDITWPTATFAES